MKRMNVVIAPTIHTHVSVMSVHSYTKHIINVMSAEQMN